MVIAGSMYVFKTCCEIILLNKWWNYTFDLPRLVISIYENPNGLPTIGKENSTHFNALLGSR